MFGAPAFGMDLSQATQSQGEGKTRPDEKQSCLPVTIRAIEHAIAQGKNESGEIAFNGEVPGMLVLVARAEEVNKQSTCMELTLNDTTGCLKARYFVTDSSGNSIMDQVSSGMYVNVYGSVRTAPTNHLAVLGMRPVRSPDEVSYHMIEVAHAYLRGKQEGQMPAMPPPKTSTVAASAPTSGYAVSASKEAPAAPAAAPAAALSEDELKSAVTAFLQKESPDKGEAGINIAEIAKQFPQTTVDKVRACLQQLVEEGEAFTTLDDNHFSML